MNKALLFIEFFNLQHPDIKLTTEEEAEGNLTFIDVLEQTIEVLPVSKLSLKF